MVTELKRIALLAGAQSVIYDRVEMQNVFADYAESNKVLCLFNEVGTINLTMAGNGVNEKYPINISFVKQVPFQETSDLNAAIMTETHNCATSFFMQLSKSQYFGKLTEGTLTKHEENINDANLIGWDLSITLDLLNGYIEC